MQPTLDCFAAEGEAQCDSFFSVKQDGLAQRWPPKEILWINPPWDLWPRAAAKLLASQCTAILRGACMVGRMGEIAGAHGNQAPICGDWHQIVPAKW